MSRLSTDQFDQNGNLINGFDYDLQVWVNSGFIEYCGHPEHDEIRDGSYKVCCNARKYGGKLLSEIKSEVLK